MESFKFNRDIAHLAVLQRIELAGTKLKKIRKFFGRYLFTNFFSKFLINIPDISKKYFFIMESEFFSIKKFLKKNQKILSIGSGIGGVETLILKRYTVNISFIERNYISKKVKYGWDKFNNEAYNNLNTLNRFLLINDIDQKNYQIFDYDMDELPKEKFDVIFSMYSLDFHYNFEIYKNYLKEISTNNTVIIFDTIRPKYFNSIFKYIEILKENHETIHKSKRIACQMFR